MRLAYSISIVLLCMSCMSPNPHTIDLLVVNNSSMIITEFNQFDCKDVLMSNIQEDPNNVDSKIKRVRKVKTIDSDYFVKLILEDISASDSIFYTLETYRITHTDTLRIGNFGGRKVDKLNGLNQIRHSICKFLNK